MHLSSQVRMKYFVREYVDKVDKKTIKVLDVGACDINGSYRKMFKGDKYEYKSLDMQDDPSVDIVLENPYNWSSIETESFDVIVSGQMFEHNEFFWLTLAEMARVLKKDGLMCIIVPHTWNCHRYPVDCYRFLTDGMVAMARYVQLEVLHAHTNCAPKEHKKKWYGRENTDSMLIAKKNYSGGTQYVDVKNYSCEPINHESIRDGFKPYKRSMVL